MRAICTPLSGLLLVGLTLAGATLTAQSLDVPIRLQEFAGVARQGEAVTFGIPLPKGLITDTERLRLVGADGDPVPASFRAVNRWWDDGSIQWVHTDFAADAAANGEALYRVRLSDAPVPEPSAKLVVNEDRDAVTVDTGPLQFEVRRLGPLFDAPGLHDVDIVLRSDERIYRAGHWAATTLEVEEKSPLKVVIKRTGSHGWLNRTERALDYQLRIVAYAGRPYVRLIYTFVNRQGQAMSDFVRLDELRLEGRLENAATPERVDQLSAEPRRPGWFQAGSVGVGMRWFWQLYPKGFEIQEDHTLRLELFPPTAKPQNVYTGVAKTHEMMLAFDGKDYSAALNDPLHGVAPPAWYTRDTGALGRLAESSPNVIRPEYWPLVEKYDRWLVESRQAVRAKRDRSFEFRGEQHDEYGVFNFGDAMHKLIPDDSRPDYGIHWESQYYDFAHALFLHFFRTGDMESYRMAIEAAAYLGDVAISHHEVEPGRDGVPRTTPALNHWVRYSDGDFISSVSWFAYKNESLFDRYLLTGDLWSRDVARLSSDFGVYYNGLDIDNNTRSIGNGLFAVLKAYEVFGDSKYLDRAHWIVDSVHTWQDGDKERLRTLNPRVRWNPLFQGGYSHQSWMYGIALEGMAQASQFTERAEMPGYMRRAADWLFDNPREWDPVKRLFRNGPIHAVMLTPGLAYIAETSGEKKYWDVSMESFQRQTEDGKVTDRLKLFGQLFRNSQRFTWYLSKYFEPPAAESSN